MRQRQSTRLGPINDYTIADRRLRIEVQTNWAAQWILGFMQGFHLRPTQFHEDIAPHVTIKVETDRAPGVPSKLESFEINHGVCFNDGSIYFLSVDESLVIVRRPEARLVEVWFGDSPHAKHPIALVNVFSYGLQAALRRAGLYDLHAAAVLEPVSGRSALFVGASGSGKTTLTLRLAEEGWHYLSDDMVLLNETDEGLKVEGLRRLFAVPESYATVSSLPKFAQMLGNAVASDPTKRRLEPDSVFPARLAAKCRPDVIFFPEVSNANASKIAPLSASEAMQQLVRFCPWATCDTHSARDYLRVISRLAKQCRSFVFHAGRDLLEAPEVASRLIGPFVLH